MDTPEDLSDSIGETLGRYRILRVVGRGGMGTVYEAEDPELGRRVALKVLPPSVASDPNRLERFSREARSVASLNHPNIVTIHSVEAVAASEGDEEIHFLTMELVPGQSMDRSTPENGLELDQILSLASQLADGLGAAHDQGIVHRDLKPANVIVDSAGRLKILDFGLAKPFAQIDDTEEVTELALTQEGTYVGTAPYMSPEQVASKPLDQRSDIFSLGSMLYEMCTGRRPFEGESFSHVLSAILRDEPIPIRELRPDLPEGLSRVVERCLAKDPAARHQSARELRESLESLRRESPSSTSGRGPGRWAGWIAAAVALIVIGILGFRMTRDREAEEIASAASKADSGLRLVAVLPLRNLGHPEDEFFAEGITEEIVTRLATVKGLGIISGAGSSSAFQESDAGEKEIGEKLGADFVLSGSVRWARHEDSPSRVRISPRLIRVEDSVHLWAQSYDRTMDDIFDIQEEIAFNVAKELGAALLDPQRVGSSEKPTENQEAYQAYLRGRFAPSSVFCASIRGRLGYLRRAVELDPQFLQAWAVLSRAYSASYAHCPEFSQADRDGGLRALERARSIDPDAWETLVAEAQYRTQIERDYVSALEPLERASQQIDTAEIHFAKGRAHRRLGRWSDALTSFERAARLDPENSDSRLASVHMWMRNYEEAIRHMDRDIEAAPSVNNYYVRKAWAYWLWKGDTPEARATLEALPADEPSMVIQWGWFWQRVYEGDFQAAIDGLDVVPDTPLMRTDIFVAPKPLLAGQAYDLLSEPELARAAYERARRLLEPEVEASPTNTAMLDALAITYSGLGLEAEARKAAAQSLAIAPIDQEPYFGQAVLLETALAYTRLGDLDAALDHLETLLGMPSAVSIPWLRLDPRWAPLWEHPRFAELEVRYG